jgi:hypothetical protein
MSAVPDPSREKPSPSSILYNWQLFSDTLTRLFQPISQSDRARTQLSRLRQHKDVHSYISAFRDVCLRIDNLSEAEKLARFKEGITDTRILTELDMRRPPTFEEATVIAERIHVVSSSITGRRHRNDGDRSNGRDTSEARLNAMSNSRPSTSRPTTSSRPATTSQPSSSRPDTARPAGKSNWLKGQVRDPTREDLDRLAGIRDRRRPLTDEERQFIIDIGACLYCRNPGHGKGECPNKAESKN